MSDYGMFTAGGERLVVNLVSEAASSALSDSEISIQVQDGIKTIQQAGFHEVTHQVVRGNIRAELSKQLGRPLAIAI